VTTLRAAGTGRASRAVPASHHTSCLGRSLLTLALVAACWLAVPPRVAAGEIHLGPAALSIIGQDTVTFRAQSVSGGDTARRAYLWDDYGLAPGFEHRTDLVLHGRLLPNITVDAAISRGPFSQGRQRMIFTLEGDDAVIKAGDLAVAFGGNGLAAFRRNLRGLLVDTKLSRGALSLVASESKPQVRTDVLYGRNSAGPYYLAATPLVDASEVVEVDGRRLRRGADYSIDYQVGLVQFSPTLIIPPTSRIAVSYEYDSPGSSSGTLVGMRATWPVTPAISVGATYLGLERRGAGLTAPATKEDRWLGTGGAGPFTLTCRPIEPGSERVRLDGILQVAGRDYRLDYTTGSIFFLSPVPAGVFVVVSYQVSGASQSASPARSLVGIDTHFAAGRHLNLDGEVAHSVGGAQSGPSGDGGALRSSGTAFAFGARGEWSRLSLAANLRSADAAFAPFEYAGQTQLRGGWDWTLGFQPVAGLRVSAAMRDYRRPYFQYGGAADASDLSVHDRSRDLALDFSRPGWPTLSYRGSWSSLAGGSGFGERRGNQVLTLGFERQAFGIKATYQRSSDAREGEAPLSPDLAPTYDTTIGDVLSRFANQYAGHGQGMSLSMYYRPGTRLNLVCDLARNGVSLAGGGKTAAGSSRVGIEYQPGRDTFIALGYRASSSGGSVSVDGREISGYANRSSTINLRHSFGSRLSFNLGYDAQLSQGGYGTNSNSDSWSGGFSWQPVKSLSLIGQYTRQNLAYLGASGRSTNDIASLGATVGPFGPGLKLDLGYSHMSGATSGNFGGDYGLYEGGYGNADYGAARGMANSSLRARLSYPIGNRQRAFAEWEGSSNAGYSGGNRRTSLGVGWQIGLTPGLNFTVDWRRVASQSSAARYSYHAQALSGSLGVKF
jgi:hypothetical protein